MLSESRESGGRERVPTNSAPELLCRLVVMSKKAKREERKVKVEKEEATPDNDDAALFGEGVRVRRGRAVTRANGLATVAVR